MPPLDFLFQDFLDEISAVGKIAGDFIDPASAHVLPNLATVLRSISAQRNGAEAVWAIYDHAPLRTKVSHGEYEIEGRGLHDLFGEITSIWRIAPSGVPASKLGPGRTFRVTGNASVRIRLIEVSAEHDRRELAMWRMELGDDAAPGCYFHVQVLGEHGRTEPPFPHSLSVPRLPSLVFTPMAALEFVIAELFQDEWVKRAAKEGGAMDVWKSIQRRRLGQLLAWKQKKLADCIGSPWTAIKCAKPESSLFLHR